ncbi:MAG: helix-turn-helix transcriptional regulator [Methylocella sp.]
MIKHVTSAQMRAARGLLNWSVRELSDRSGVHRNTITNFETEKSGGDPETLHKLMSALEAAGVEFTNGGRPGVCLPKSAKASDEAAESEQADDNTEPEPAVEKNAALTQVDGVSRVRDPLKRRYAPGALRASAARPSMSLRSNDS